MEDRSPYAPAEQGAYPDPNTAQLPPQGPFYSNPNEQSPDIAEKFIQDAAKFALQPSADDTLRSRNASHEYAQHPAYGDVQVHDDVELQQATEQGRMVQGIVEGMSVEQQQQVLAQQGADANQRKRTKVSRACDECRRKKIRCDATDVDSVEPCSSCKKTGQPCLFSRHPLKRGPSKGYIKELAERLNTLENQLGNSPQHQQQDAQQHNMQRQPPSQYPDGTHPEQIGYRELEQQLRAASPTYNGSRKRTHSASEGRTNLLRRESPQAPNYSRDSPWSPEVSRQIPVTSLLSDEHAAPMTSSRDVHPGRHSHRQPYSFSDGRHDNVREQSQHISAIRPTPPDARADPPTTLEWNEEVIDE